MVRQTPGHPVVGISERLRFSSGQHAYGAAARPLRFQIKDGVVLEYIHVQHFQPFLVDYLQACVMLQCNDR